MIDRANTLDSNGDLIYVETRYFQAENILNLSKGEDRFYANLGIDFDLLFNQNLTETVYLKFITNELGRFGASPGKIEKINVTQKGVLELALEYSYNVVNYQTGNITRESKKIIGHKRGVNGNTR